MHYHFIGIKGSGMASLAEIVADRGDEVSGSDIEKYIFTQKPLEERGIPIYPFSADNVRCAAGCGRTCSRHVSANAG